MKCGECVTELMAGTWIDGPFLGEGINPILAVPIPLKTLNVLHDSEFLIVGFLDQEAVVLDSGRVVARSGGRVRVFFSISLVVVGMWGRSRLCQQFRNK